MINEEQRLKTTKDTPNRNISSKSTKRPCEKNDIRKPPLRSVSDNLLWPAGCWSTWSIINGYEKFETVHPTEFFLKKSPPSTDASYLHLGLNNLTGRFEAFSAIWQRYLTGQKAIGQAHRNESISNKDELIMEFGSGAKENSKGVGGDLAELGILCTKDNVTYIAIEVAVSERSTGGITDIGLSVWSPGTTGSDIIHHWHVDDHNVSHDPQDYDHPDSFAFGQTEFIATSQITIVLDDWFVLLARNCSRVCLVEYGKSTLRHLEPEWSVPSTIIRLDVHKICQQRQGAIRSVTLEESLKVESQEDYPTYLLANLGNRVHFIMRLTKKLLKLMKAEAKGNSGHIKLTNAGLMSFNNGREGRSCLSSEK